MARPLAPAEHEKMRVQAYDLSVRGTPHREIAKLLGVSANTVASLVREERSMRRRERTSADEEAIATYREVIREAWERLARLKDASLNVAGLCNVILQAQNRIDQITGVKAPVKSHWYGRLERMDLSRLSNEELETLERILSASIVGEPGSVEALLPYEEWRGELPKGEDDVHSS